MLKEKLPLIILLVLLLISGIITFNFYSQIQQLAAANDRLKQEKAKLTEENKSLYSKYKDVEKRYRDGKSRLEKIQKELARVEQDKNDLKERYEAVSRERDQLVEKIQELNKAKQNAVKPSQGLPGKAVYSDEYWADVVKQKAQLQSKFEGLQKKLLDATAQIAKLQKENKELSLKIDELSKSKDKLEMEMSFKERTMEIMSRDLVSEREARKRLADELEKLRDENISLKRELIVANNDKIKLQDKLKEAVERKVKLEKMVSEVENVLKEKTLLFSELESQLTKAIGKKEDISGKSSASVELPPIVVKSESEGSRLKGEILAVNKNDNFVIIDLGRDSGVKPGMEFNVTREGETIGVIKVIETRREIAAADIEEITQGYSIREGDLVSLK